MAGERQSANLADLLERILDKGIVIVGDVRVNLLDIELLTIKLRLLVASVDRAREMGIDWWEHDPSLSSKARTDRSGGDGRVDGAADRELLEENRRLRERLAALEAGDGATAAADTERSGGSERSGARRSEGKEAGS
ncbi:gas vesicle protein [Actinomadura sp. NPDC048394]|jgi:hypothetical protein|uniref:gas vesicle protein n=1 Tax=Actinomadura sp. NPDC048394 TaxID=3158223 RepID=UPI0033E85194